MAENVEKKPSKGILKNSSSFENRDTPTSTSSKGRKKSKETKWDEMNIIATLHPADKDYGHMKIEEPKTPYHYEEEGVDITDAGVDPALLAERMRMGAASPPKGFRESDEDGSDEEEEETLEQKAARKSFESKRSAHYNEFNAVKLARKLMEEASDDEAEEKADSEPSEKSPRHDSQSSCHCNNQPSSSK